MFRSFNHFNELSFRLYASKSPNRSNSRSFCALAEGGSCNGSALSRIYSLSKSRSFTNCSLLNIPFSIVLDLLKRLSTSISSGEMVCNIVSTFTGNGLSQYRAVPFVSTDIIWAKLLWEHGTFLAQA